MKYKLGSLKDCSLFLKTQPIAYFWNTSAKSTQSFSRPEGKICMKYLTHICSFGQAIEGSQHRGLHRLGISKNTLMTLAPVELPRNLYYSLVRFHV